MDRSLDNSNGVSIDSSLSGEYGSIFIDETGFFDFSREDGKLKIEDISKNIIYPYRLFYFIWSSKQNSITIIDLFDYQTERNRSFEKINITFLRIDRNAKIDRSFFAIQYYPFDKPSLSSSTRILYSISTSATRFFSKKSWTNDLRSRAPSISDFPFSPFSIARVSARRCLLSVSTMAALLQPLSANSAKDYRPPRTFAPIMRLYLPGEGGGGGRMFVFHYTVT